MKRIKLESGRLKLEKQSLRALTSEALEQVAGGSRKPTYATCTTDIETSNCPTITLPQAR